MDNKIPYEIDIDNDGENDFYFNSFQETIEDPYNIAYLDSQLDLKTLGDSNFLLGDFEIVMSPSQVFSISAAIQPSENLPIDSANIPEELGQAYVGTYRDFIAEQHYPMKKYNLWTGYLYWNGENQDLTDYYVVVKKIVNGEPHYGYINFSILGNDCEIIIHETYLNPIPNEHVIIE